MSDNLRNFQSIYSHGFIRVGTATPRLRISEPRFNSVETLRLAHEAHAQHLGLVVFPELGLSGYSNDDLFFQDALLDEVEREIGKIVKSSQELFPVIIVGAPLRVDGRLFNVAVTIHKGKVLGLVPKSYLPNYREFYERRQFTPGNYAQSEWIQFAGQEVPFGTDIVYQASDYKDFVLHTEVCEDLWVPIPPSSFAAMAGATVLINLSASNITISKSDYRHSLCRTHSQRCMAAYLYSAAGSGESTTDLAWDGHAMIYENGELLAESGRFTGVEELVCVDVDLERLRQERMRTGTFSDCAAEFSEKLKSFRRVNFCLGSPSAKNISLQREVSRFPFVPSDNEKLYEQCYEAYNIQVHGLQQRLESSGLKKIVIGVSGGLDSTHALLVAVKTFDRLGLPRSNILAYTLPGFATSDLTKNNAWKLMAELGVSAKEVSIGPSSMQTLSDIEHPFSEGVKDYDITFENVQAGARTALLFRLANHNEALVLGTGDLSELALGWCTYGVGDHMSHYNVNCSVPKTLIQHLIRWVISTSHFGEKADAVLEEILNTTISPELVPGENDDSTQSTEEYIGPYELQDFNLFYVSRYSLKPSKVAFLALHAWGDLARGVWPEGIVGGERHEYDLGTIKKWLNLFLFRFFQTSQFKRSAVPNGPKVGSGGSLSPRGDWRAPSDSSANVWLAELEENVPEKL